MFNWLASVAPHLEYTNALMQHLPRTGAWFLGGPLTIWKELPDDQAAVLWLQGKCMYSRPLGVRSSSTAALTGFLQPDRERQRLCQYV